MMLQWTRRRVLPHIGTCLGLVLLTVFLVCATTLFGQSSPSPRSLKQGAISTLEQVSIPDKDLREAVAKATKSISQSLADDKNRSLFLDELRVLPRSVGTRVFEQEAEAADQLIKLSTAKNTPANVVPV